MPLYRPDPRDARTGCACRKDPRRLRSRCGDHLTTDFACEGCGGAPSPRCRDAGLRGLRAAVGEAVIGLVAVTANGHRRATHLAEIWEDACLYDDKPKE